MQPENNYLYFVVRDDNQKIRANIIGTQHTVDWRDKNLNSKIIDAIKRSSTAVLEIPPNSKLIPSVPSPEWVIGREIGPLKQKKSESIDSSAISSQIEFILKNIKENTDPEDYEKVLVALEEISSNQNKLIFVEAIQKNISEFNEVSLEENINKLVIENQIEVTPLEDIDLADLLAKANEKMEKAQQRTEQHIKRLKEQRDHTKKGKAGRVKRRTLNRQIQIHEERLQKLRGEKQSRNNEIRLQSIQKELYSAWVKGDTLELSKLLDECHELYKESPEIAKIHAPRDKNMAKRIVDVVMQAKEDEKEALIVLGCAHLLYSKRKNVIEFLNEQFKTDLKGWSITQVK